MLGEHPPNWLRWANTTGARATTTLIAIITLVACAFLAVRQQSYVECIAEQQQAIQARTRAISAATDIERAADAALIEGPRPGGPSAEELRASAAAARRVTDLVRERNQPAPINRC